MKHALGTVAGLVILSVSLGAQAQGQKSSQSPGLRPGQPKSENAEELQRNFLLTGRVLMADGTPLPNFVQVDMFCNGRIRQQTLASGNGAFTFELNTIKPSSIMDASASSTEGLTPGTAGTGDRSYGRIPGDAPASVGMGRVDLNGCELKISSVPGYISDSVQLGRMSIFDYNVGDILLRPMARMKGTTVSAKAMQAPKQATAELDKARKELSRKDASFEKALASLQKCLQLYPDYAEAWNLMGEAHTAQKNFQEAQEAFEKAISVDPNYIQPYVSMARMELMRNRLPQAVQLTDKILELHPYMPQGRYYHALAHFQAGDYAIAEESIRMIRDSQGKKFPMVYYMLGVILSEKKDFPGAAAEFNLFLELLPAGSTSDLSSSARRRLADWQQQGLIKAEGPPRKP
jgi:Tfp pilus assembly protein PilF